MAQPRKKYNKGRSSKFPGSWTQWEWNDTWNKDSRYRQLSENDEDLEFEYRDPPQTAEAPGVEPSSSDTTSQQYGRLGSSPGNDSNYTYNIGDFTEQFGRTTLSSGEYAGFSQPETHQTPFSTQVPALYQSHVQLAAQQPSYAGFPIGSNSFYPGEHGAATTPRTTSVEQRHIYTEDASADKELNPDYKKHKSYEFKFGRVFKVLWSEPQGSNGTDLTERIHLKKARYGENAYHSIRRFVIIREEAGHCICLPVLTYGGQGTLKRGVHPEHHAIIYTGKSPVMDKNEQITKKSIQMEPNSKRHKLDPFSRINYAKLYTVEHNVKVQFIGKIAERHEQRIVTDYNFTHQPLADRPYHGDFSETATEHAEGVAGYTYPAPYTAPYESQPPHEPTEQQTQSANMYYSLSDPPPLEEPHQVDPTLYEPDE